jgi:predicted nucleic acid-binding protein
MHHTTHSRYKKLLYKITQGTAFRELSKAVYMEYSAVAMATGYGLEDRGVRVRESVRSRIFSSPRLDRLWGPLGLLSNGYRGLPGDKAAGA